MNEQMELYHFICRSLKNQGFSNKDLNDFKNFEANFSEEEFKTILRIKQNRKNKRYRTKKKFIEILELRSLLKLTGKNVNLVFGTCTLKPKELKNQERTRVKKLDKWLKKHFLYVIVNKDFGKKKEREHYHFIGITIEEIEEIKKIKSNTGRIIYELKQKDYELGFEPDLCIIDLKENDIEKTINYLLKLNNHSNKNTTKNRTRVLKNKMFSILLK